MDYTTTGLLASIRRRGMLPSSSVNGTDDDSLIALANEVLQAFVAPFILDVREGYLLARTPRDLSITSGQSAYRLPPRAIGNKLREVTLLDASGNPQNVPCIDMERLQDFAASGAPTGFYVSGAYLVLVPTPSSTQGTLRMDYYLRPSSLVSDATLWATVTAISADRANIDISGPVTDLADGVAFDIIKASSPFDVLHAGLTGIVTTGPDNVRLSSGTFSDDLEVGDYVALADTAPVATIPAEIHPVLAQATVCKVLEALGDREGLAAAEAKLQREMDAARTLISPRVDGESEKVSGGFLRRLQGWSGGGW